MKYGVLGKSLPHTYSPQIHNEFADYEYGILERTEEGVHAIFEGKEDLAGFNVTIPYKKLAMSLCDEVSEEASEVGAVNTVVKLPGGGFKGYNTDVYGFMYMLRRRGISVKGKSCLVLGTGGASAAVTYALKKLGANYVDHCSRTGDINYDNVHELKKTVNVIVNTTPVGMYPNSDESPLSLDGFTDLYAVCDVIYNPGVTRLLYDAETRGLKTSGGLAMLVAQAYEASLIFRGEKRELDERADEAIEKVISLLEKNMMNITLIGMPGSGKSTVGKKIAAALNREFVDLDDAFTEEYKVTPSEVIQTKGEDEFRRMETEIAKSFLHRSSLVISTGGGIITREENAFPLRCNSKVIYIKRPLECLMKQNTGNRPISRDKGIEALLEKRAPLYEKYSDTVWDLPDFEEGDKLIDKLIKEL